MRKRRKVPFDESRRLMKPAERTAQSVRPLGPARRRRAEHLEVPEDYGGPRYF